MSDTDQGDDMTPLQRAASALLSDLHNSGVVICQDVDKAAGKILAAMEAVAAAEREACAKIAYQAAGWSRSFSVEEAAECIAGTILSRGEKA